MNIKDNIADEFNEFNKNYTDDMIRCVPHYLELISCFTKKFSKDFNPKNILDLGCGNGNITQELLPLFPDASYTLLDASPQMINSCKVIFQHNNMKFENKYFQDFHFNDNYYDLVVASFSLHHCESIEKKDLFQKIYRSLKKDGVFMYADLMISKDNVAHTDLLKKWESFVTNNYPDKQKWLWLMEHYKEFDSPNNYYDQMDWLKKIGFENIASTSYETYWVYTNASKL